jgi:hypothetical protein
MKEIFPDRNLSREDLISGVSSIISEKDKAFLLSFCAGTPDWSLAPVNKMSEYPSIKWKLFNIGKMSKKKREQNVIRLKRCLEGV